MFFIYLFLDMERRRKFALYILLTNWHLELVFLSIMMYLCLLELIKKRNERKMIRSRPFVNHASRLHYLDSIIGNGDLQCIHQLRMDRRTFGLLCELLRSRGKVKVDGLVTVEEQVCMFLHILSHHVKNRTISSRVFQSGEIVSRYFNSVLKGVLWLQSILLRAPEPMPENCTDWRWKWFKVFNYLYYIFLINHKSARAYYLYIILLFNVCRIAWGY